MASPTVKRLSVAIDGPAGAGKSTTARMLASRLGYVYVDSGAMYRAVALQCIEKGVSPENPEAVAALARSLDIRFEPAAEGGMEQKVFIGFEEVTRAIRTPEISQLASTVSTIHAVRESLVAKQRSLGEAGGVVMEGSDIGTVVLPRAEVKIFLTASLEERAHRRFVEFEQKGASVTPDQVRADMAERDRRDCTRDISPLMPAEDSVLLDSENMTAAQVADAILDVCAARMAGG